MSLRRIVAALGDIDALEIDSADASSAVVRDDAGVPERFCVLKRGPIHLSCDGRIIEGVVAASDLAEIAGYYELKKTLIPVDCQHYLQQLADTLGEDETALVEQIPLLGERAAAGFVALELERDSKGSALALWANVASWTGRARALLSREGSSDGAAILYYSPTVRGLTGGGLRISSIALTNSPSINGLPAIGGVLAACEGPAADTANLENKPKHAREKTMKLEELLISARTLLTGLDSSVALDDEPAQKSFLDSLRDLVALRDKLDSTLAELRPALSLGEKAGLDALAGKALAMAEQVKSLDSDRAALGERLEKLEKSERQRGIDQLMRDGKLSDAMRPWAERQSAAALSDWAATAPVIVPRERRATDTPPDKAALSDADKTIALRCGIDPQKLDKLSNL